MAAATADFILSGLALSGSVVLGNWNFYRCGMGQRVLGSYWAWDPKEVWALITFMLYGMAFHVQSIPRFRNPYFFIGF